MEISNNRMLLLIMIFITIIHNIYAKLKFKNEYETYGVLLLDSITFPKIVPSKEISVVVLVTNKKSIGDYGTDSIREDYFYFCKESTTSGNTDSVIFSQVIVNGAQNQKLAQSIGVPNDFQHPLLFIYPRNSNESIQFPKYEKFNIATLTKFVSKHVDFFYGLPGLVESMNDIAVTFTKYNKDAQQKLYDEALKLLPTVKENQYKDSKFYLKVMKNIISSGLSYIVKELKRLDKIIESDKISDDNKRELARKRNILNQFHYDEESIKYEL